MTEIMEAARRRRRDARGRGRDRARRRWPTQVKSIDADLQRWRDHEKLDDRDGRAGAGGAARPRQRLQPRLGQAERPARDRVCRAGDGAAASARATSTRPPSTRNAGTTRPRKCRCSQGRGRARHDDRCDLGAPLVNQNDRERLHRAAAAGDDPRQDPGLCATCRSTVKVPMQTAGGTYGWVGEAKPKPVTKLAFASRHARRSRRSAGIIVLTEELVRLSNPSRRGARARRHGRRDRAVPRSAVHRPGRRRRRRRQSRRRSRTAPPTAATTQSARRHHGADQITSATNNMPVDGVTFIMSRGQRAVAVVLPRTSTARRNFPGVGSTAAAIAA